MAHITTDGNNVNINNIYVDVTCGSCDNSYSVRMDKPRKMKNCHCGKGTFRFRLTPAKGKIIVVVEFSKDGYSFSAYEPLRVYLEE